MTIGSILRRMRENKGITIKSLALALKRDERDLLARESGACSFTFQEVTDYMTACGYEKDHLLCMLEDLL